MIMRSKVRSFFLRKAFFAVLLLFPVVYGDTTGDDDLVATLVATATAHLSHTPQQNGSHYEDQQQDQLDTSRHLVTTRWLQSGTQSTLLCRCQAEFEDFYKVNRYLAGNINYRSILVDSNGYYVVDGLTVLPNSFGDCRGRRMSQIEDDEWDDSEITTNNGDFTTTILDEDLALFYADKHQNEALSVEEEPVPAQQFGNEPNDIPQLEMSLQNGDNSNDPLSLTSKRLGRKLKGKKGLKGPGEPGYYGEQKQGIKGSKGKKANAAATPKESGGLFDYYIHGYGHLPKPMPIPFLPPHRMKQGMNPSKKPVQAPAKPPISNRIVRPDIFPCPDPEKGLKTRRPSKLLINVDIAQAPRHFTPVSEAPTTAAPVTAAPTTAAPTTAAPTTPSPTAAPTNLPTTAKPTLSPTVSVPTGSPQNTVDVKSLADTGDGSGCGIDLVIDCQTATGKNCRDIDYPTEMTCDGRVNVLYLRYNANSCDQSHHQQAEAAQCLDLGIMDASTEVMITCLRENGKFMRVSPLFVSDDMVVSVTKPNGKEVAKSINCTITGEDGSVLQSVAIDMSGASPLSLKDKFGALTVERCDDVTCIEDANFKYSIYNVDVNDMEITKVGRGFDDKSKSFLDILPSNPIDGDSSISFQESIPIDVCKSKPQKIRTKLSVHGIAAGFPKGCDAEEYYKIVIKPPAMSESPSLPLNTTNSNVGSVDVGSAIDPLAYSSSQCKLDVKVQCETAAKANCRGLSYPKANQCITPIDTMIFRYVISSCDKSVNHQHEGSQCTDGVSTSNTSASVMISCKGDDGDELEVSPFIVSPKDVFSVVDNMDAELPSSITCTITDAEGVEIQVVIIKTGDASNYPIFLGDRFGRLTVEGCDAVTCVEELHISYALHNAGSMGTYITSISRDLDGDTKNILNYLPMNPMYPAESTSIEEIMMVDVCRNKAVQYEADVSVVGVISGGSEHSGSCSVSDKYKFEVQSATRTP